MGCLVVAEFLVTSMSRGPSAIAEPLVSFPILLCDPKFCSHSETKQ